MYVREGGDEAIYIPKPTYAQVKEAIIEQVGLSAEDFGEFDHDLHFLGLKNAVVPWWSRRPKQEVFVDGWLLGVEKSAESTGMMGQTLTGGRIEVVSSFFGRSNLDGKGSIQWVRIWAKPALEAEDY